MDQERPLFGEIIDIEVGKFLKAQRLKRGIPPKTLARRLNKDMDYVEKLEEGRASVGMDQFIELAKAMRVPPLDFFAGLLKAMNRG